jgi:hypothetical protein
LKGGRTGGCWVAVGRGNRVGIGQLKGGRTGGLGSSREREQIKYRAAVGTGNRIGRSAVGRGNRVGRAEVGDINIS